VTIEQSVRALETYALPGDAVFPESIGVDARTGDAFVGSLSDGTIFRVPGRRGDAEVWSPGSEGGRTSVAGVKVDRRGRLWTAGGFDGTLDVYDLESRRRVARFEVGQSPSCVNDLAFGPDGTAYITDSFVPTLLRVGPGLDAMEAWVDLVGSGVPWPAGINFNGIVLGPDGHHLVCSQTNLGRFWRVDLDTRHVSEVILDAGTIEHCDGLAIRGSTLYAAVNARERLAVITLEPDARSGRVTALLSCGDFAFPTAVALDEERLLVVNAQLDQMGGAPRRPFTVIAIAAPDSQ
jgi:sugar lactone lactonase YvrE